jgi:hypothetical protein
VTRPPIPLLTLTLMMACGSGSSRAKDGPADGASDGAPNTTPGDGGSTPGSPGTDEPDDGCGVTVVGLVPGDGDSHYYRDPLLVQLSDADPTATLTLTGSEGEVLPGALDHDDRVVLFTPDQPLAPDTDWLASLTWCGGTTDIAFRTSSFGQPTADCAEGGAWVLSLDEGQVQSPGSLTPYVLGSLEEHLVVGLVEVEGETAAMRISWSRGTGGTQDFCRATTDVDAATWADPHFETEPVDLLVNDEGGDIVLASSVLSGDISSDCATAGGVRLETQLDARRLGTRWNEALETDDPDAICIAFSGFGIDCGPCTTDGEPFCIDLKLAGIPGVVAPEGLECVAEDDCHRLCTTNRSDCDAAAWPTCEDPAQ